MTVQQTRAGRIAIRTTLILFVPIFIDLFTSYNEFDLDHFVIKYLFIPIIILGIATDMLLFGLKEEYYNILRGIDKRLKSRLKLIWLLIITSPGLILLYFALMKSVIGLTNRYLGHQEQIVLEGKITYKNAIDNRSRIRHYFEIDSKELNRKVEIKVEPSAFNNYKIGDIYSEQLFKGSLGFLYKHR